MVFSVAEKIFVIALFSRDGLKRLLGYVRL